jgi:muramoyltetrapeptide carboxypeptidase
MTSMTLFSPSGVLTQRTTLRLAKRRLDALGFDTYIDEDAFARHQRFAGSDALRLAALHRVARTAPAIAMPSQGGYGFTRLLDGIDWSLLRRSVEKGTRWVGHSDMTALHMGLLAHKAGSVTWAGPLAFDFGRSDAAGGVDEVTRDCFVEAMSGSLEAVGFRTEAGFDGLEVKGQLWGGNLTMLMSLLGTPYWPRIKGGVLFLEDVNEHPYRVERALLQLHQAGVLAAQKAVVLGAVSAWKPAAHDRGYALKTMVAHVRQVCATPLLTGLPFGHVNPKVTMPVGAKVQLVVDGRNVLIGW